MNIDEMAEEVAVAAGNYLRCDKNITERTIDNIESRIRFAIKLAYREGAMDGIDVMSKKWLESIENGK